MATKGNEASQSSVKSEEKKLRVGKVKEELPLLQTKSQLGCSLGLSYWQKKKLQKLSAQELKERTWHGLQKEVLKIRIM